MHCPNQSLKLWFLYMISTEFNLTWLEDMQFSLELVGLGGAECHVIPEFINFRDG